MSGRVVVLVSGAGSNMLALADACERGNLDARVVAVAADRDCRGLAAASERGIAAELVPPNAFPTRAQWNHALRDVVQSCRPASRVATVVPHEPAPSTATLMVR